MPETNMTVNIVGLVNSIKLTERNYLFPLFEAVINSIQSIQLNHIPNGEISIFIHRPEASQGTIDGGIDQNRVIEGFEIVDNGGGFKETNFEAFKEAFTDNKIELGCKGVGRFMMLATFNNVSFNSVYYNAEEKSLYQREFTFDTSSGITEISNNPVDQNTATKTTLRLRRYKRNFLKNTDAYTVARKLIEHCLIYFINNVAPQIILYDTVEPEPISLNQLFETIYEVDELVDQVDIDGHKFDLNLVKNFRKQHGHQIHYCANNRVVNDFPLSKLIPVLNKHRFEDENRGDYALDVYCYGDMLNSSVENFRDEFRMPKKRTDVTAVEPVSLEDLNESIAERVRDRFGDELTAFEDENLAEIVEFVNRENMVEYRHLLHQSELIKNIPPGLSDTEKDSHLHKVNYEFERKQKALVNGFLSKAPDDIRNNEEYKKYFEELETLLSQQHDLGASRLAKYMLHRKTIIRVFEKFLELQTNGKYKLEQDLHDIIFKRDTTSNQIKFNEHNLWILDERLAYHQYVASEKGFNSIEILNSDSSQAADLFIYDNKFAFGIKDESVVIFEFKRPMRTAYKQEEKDLGAQIKRYINTLIDKEVKDYRGRPHHITTDTPKFGFVICDLTGDIETILARESYRKTPKGTYFKYEEGLTLFMEVMTFDQLLTDVNLRHKAFFSNLGIDTV